MPDLKDLDVVSAHDERRHYERSLLIIDVFFDGKDATGVASTKDLGAGGLYLNTQADLPEGAVLLLRIPFREKQIVVNAQVVYRNAGRGVGLRFQELSQEDQKVIEEDLAGR
jgi:PilZ domain